MPDSLRRATRTWVQAFTGAILFQLAAVMLDISQGNWVPDLDFLKRLALSAFIAGAVSVISYLHNWAEDAGAIPSVLKATASSGASPVTHDPVK